MHSKLFRIKTNRSNMLSSNNLKDLIVNLLSNIVPNPQDYVNDDKMLIWNEAFTHETFDPTFNYENKEYIGDRNVKVIFPIYLLNRYPNLTRKEITYIDTLVMEA